MAEPAGPFHVSAALDGVVTRWLAHGGLVDTGDPTVHPDPEITA